MAMSPTIWSSGVRVTVAFGDDVSYSCCMGDDNSQLEIIMGKPCFIFEPIII